MLEIPTLSSFGCQLVEEVRQYSTHIPIMHILQQLVIKVNYCCKFWLFKIIHNEYLTQANLIGPAAVKMDNSETPGTLRVYEV